ncbi:hypothetical protein N7475_001672 [Penicillium sp. IBT 31633x]|nr:hypothetical protein N7475_001672 [Penicillium sp. IBT 31633x]
MQAKSAMVGWFSQAHSALLKTDEARRNRAVALHTLSRLSNPNCKAMLSSSWSVSVSLEDSDAAVGLVALREKGRELHSLYAQVARSNIQLIYEYAGIA